MNTSYGWIKLYGFLLEGTVYQKSAYFYLWVTLLLMAAHHKEQSAPNTFKVTGNIFGCSILTRQYPHNARVSNCLLTTDTAIMN